MTVKTGPRRSGRTEAEGLQTVAETSGSPHTPQEFEHKSFMSEKFLSAILHFCVKLTKLMMTSVSDPEFQTKMLETPVWNLRTNLKCTLTFNQVDLI